MTAAQSFPTQSEFTPSEQTVAFATDLVSRQAAAVAALSETARELAELPDGQLRPNSADTSPAAVRWATARMLRAQMEIAEAENVAPTKVDALLARDILDREQPGAAETAAETYLVLERLLARIATVHRQTAWSTGLDALSQALAQASDRQQEATDRYAIVRGAYRRLFPDAVENFLLPPDPTYSGAEGPLGHLDKLRTRLGRDFVEYPSRFLDIGTAKHRYQVLTEMVATAQQQRDWTRWATQLETWSQWVDGYAREYPAAIARREHAYRALIAAAHNAGLSAFDIVDPTRWQQQVFALRDQVAAEETLLLRIAAQDNITVDELRLLRETRLAVNEFLRATEHLEHVETQLDLLLGNPTAEAALAAVVTRPGHGVTEYALPDTGQLIAPPDVLLAHRLNRCADAVLDDAGRFYHRDYGDLGPADGNGRYVSRVEQAAGGRTDQALPAQQMHDIAEVVDLLRARAERLPGSSDGIGAFVFVPTVAGVEGNGDLGHMYWVVRWVDDNGDEHFDRRDVGTGLVEPDFVIGPEERNRPVLALFLDEQGYPEVAKHADGSVPAFRGDQDFKVGATPEPLPYISPRPGMPRLPLELSEARRAEQGRQWGDLLDEVAGELDRAAAIEQWWNDLDERNQRELLFAAHDLMLEIGMPDSLVDQANRTRLELARRALLTMAPTPENVAALAELDAVVDRLTMLENWASQLPGHPPIHLLSIDLPGRPAATMISVGNTRTAPNLVTHVTAASETGMGEVAETDLVRLMNELADAPAGAVAAVLWVESAGAPETGDLQAAGEQLAADLFSRVLFGRSEPVQLAQFTLGLGDGATLATAAAGSRVSDGQLPPPQPVNEEQTDAGRRPAQAGSSWDVLDAALSWAGFTSIEEMLVPVNIMPAAARRIGERNYRAWQQWPPYVRRHLQNRYPDVLAAAPGIPAAVRDAASKETLQWAQSGELHSGAVRLPEIDVRRVADLSNWVDTPRFQAEVGPAYRLGYGQTTDGRLQLSFAFGDPDRAPRVQYTIVELDGLILPPSIDRTGLTYSLNETLYRAGLRAAGNTLRDTVHQLQLADPEAAVVVLVREPPFRRTMTHGKVDGNDLTRVVAADNAVREQRDPLRRRPQTDVNIRSAHEQVGREVFMAGLRREADSIAMPTANQSWFRTPQAQIRAMLPPIRRGLAAVESDMTRIVATLRLPTGDPVELTSQQLRPNEVLSTLRQLIVVLGPAMENPGISDAVRGLFGMATVYVQQAALEQLLRQYLDSDRQPERLIASPTTAKQELVTRVIDNLMAAFRFRSELVQLAEHILGADNSVELEDFKNLRLDLLQDSAPQADILPARLAFHAEADAIHRITGLLGAQMQWSIRVIERRFLEDAAYTAGLTANPIQAPGLSILERELRAEDRVLVGLRQQISQLAQFDEVVGPRRDRARRLRALRVERAALHRELAEAIGKPR